MGDRVRCPAPNLCSQPAQCTLMDELLPGFVAVRDEAWICCSVSKLKKRKQFISILSLKSLQQIQLSTLTARQLGNNWYAGIAVTGLCNCTAVKV